jgi:Rrf2 family protein
MIISAKTHYAVLAILEMARCIDHARPLSIRAIATPHAIPIPFLTQILQTLKTVGLVSSTRGPSGGYRLKASPESISLAAVFDAVCESSSGVCGVDRELSGDGQFLQSFWQELDTTVRRRLETTSIAELVQQSDARTSQTSAMFYI